MKKLFLIAFIIFIVAVALGYAQEPAADNNDNKGSIISDNSLKYLAAAIAIGFATIGSGLAIGKIGSAAMGAISEKPEVAGTAIILAALAEGVCLWGFLIAFFILQK